MQRAFGKDDKDIAGVIRISARINESGGPRSDFTGRTGQEFLITAVCIRGWKAADCDEKRRTALEGIYRIHL